MAYPEFPLQKWEPPLASGPGYPQSNLKILRGLKASQDDIDSRAVINYKKIRSDDVILTLSAAKGKNLYI